MELDYLLSELDHLLSPYLIKQPSYQAITLHPFVFIMRLRNSVYTSDQSGEDLYRAVRDPSTGKVEFKPAKLIKESGILRRSIRLSAVRSTPKLGILRLDYN